jgi:ABC-type hemin transport system substrate-binding protein
MPELTVKAALEGLQQELRQAEDLKQHERVAEIKTRIRQLKRAVNRVEKAERKKKRSRGRLRRPRQNS